MDWKEEILEAFKQGKTIQVNSNDEGWINFERQNQLDRPNLDFGTYKNWRIKPNYDAEREQILKDSGRDVVTPMMKEDRMFSRHEMFLFVGFFMAKKKMDPAMNIGDILDEFNTSLHHV